MKKFIIAAILSLSFCITNAQEIKYIVGVGSLEAGPVPEIGMSVNRVQGNAFVSPNGVGLQGSYYLLHHKNIEIGPALGAIHSDKQGYFDYGVVMNLMMKQFGVATSITKNKLSVGLLWRFEL